MKKATLFLIITVIISCIVITNNTLDFYNSKEDNTLDIYNSKENISSYNIKNRYDCKKIQDDKEYNKCVMFYLEKTPYKLGDDLVLIRPIK